MRRIPTVIPAIQATLEAIAYREPVNGRNTKAMAKAVTATHNPGFQRNDWTGSNFIKDRTARVPPQTGHGRPVK